MSISKRQVFKMPSNPTMDVRHPTYMPPDHRIHQMNRRMQDRPDGNDIQWWDMFVTEFFEDKSTFMLSFYLEDGPKHYSLGRTLIPRFFKTMFEDGVVDMSFVLIHPKDYHNSAANCIALESDLAHMITHHIKPLPTKVYAEGKFTAEFCPNEFMRLRSLHFAIRNNIEFIPRQAIMQSPAVLEDLSKNATRAGLTHTIITFLKMCAILEPMKELMSRQKTYSMDPRDCLRNCLFQKWSRMLNPPADQTPRPNKRVSRKRKNSSTTNANNAGQGSKKKTFSSSDVLQVGEPTLMGSEFGDEDERTIQRLENNQFDNQMQVKAEDRDSSANFPSISSPNTTQWQQPITSAMQNNAAITPKSELPETSTEQTTPLATSS